MFSQLKLNLCDNRKGEYGGGIEEEVSNLGGTYQNANLKMWLQKLGLER